MFDERIFKAFKYRIGECKHLFPRQPDPRYDLLHHHCIHEGSQVWVLHDLPDNLESGKITGQDSRSMRAVQNTDLAFPIGGLVIGEDNREARFFKWKNI